MVSASVYEHVQIRDVLSGLAYLHTRDPPIVHGNLNVVCDQCS